MPRKTIAVVRISISIALMAIGSFCALQVMVVGITYGDMYGIKELANRAAQVQHRGQQYLWACILLQVLNATILAPLFSFLRKESSRSVLPRVAVRYSSALLTSVIGTGIGLGLRIWVLRS